MSKRLISLADRAGLAGNFMKKNRQLVSFAGGGLLLLIVLALFRNYYLGTQEKNAQADMYQAVYYFEEDSLARALEGDGIHYGLLDILEEYSGTPSANLAHFYAGVCYLKMANFEEAIVHLKDFDSDDLLLQGRAYALIGDAYAELADYSEAARYYLRGAHYEENELFTPTYLEKAAVAWEAAGESSRAIACYEEIETDYPKSRAYSDAVKHVARLRATQSLPAPILSDSLEAPVEAPLEEGDESEWDE